MPLATASARARSMTARRSPSGTAPTTGSPLTTKVGVASMPRLVPRATSAATRVAASGAVMHTCQAVTSRPGTASARRVASSHSKSENSTTVTQASPGPRWGESPTGTLSRDPTVLDCPQATSAARSPATDVFQMAAGRTVLPPCPRGDLRRALLEQVQGLDAQRLGENFQRLQRRRALAPLQHRDVGDRETGLLGDGLLRKLAPRAGCEEVLGDDVGED